MENIFFTSNTFFGNEYFLNRLKRPYVNKEEMTWDIVKKWNTVVTKDDTVYHLGGFGDFYYLYKNILNYRYLIFMRYGLEKSIFLEEEKVRNLKVIDDEIHILNEFDLRLSYFPKQENTEDKKYKNVFGCFDDKKRYTSLGFNVNLDANDFNLVNLSEI